jgi:hypothetical protein
LKVKALRGAPRSRSKPYPESGMPRSGSKRLSSPMMRPFTRVIPVASSSSARSSMLAPLPKNLRMNELVPNVGSPPPWRYMSPLKTPVIGSVVPSLSSSVAKVASGPSWARIALLVNSLVLDARMRGTEER